MTFVAIGALSVKMRLLRRAVSLIKYVPFSKLGNSLKGKNLHQEGVNYGIVHSSLWYGMIR